ncbi:MAG: YceH family protein [Gammaproteobacteria bacterium]|nr:YceH family protein [Gammaproteobacteria bacterium]NVK86751.1 YceH family protein [Gammaproteobacteria bacterium]
MAIQLTSHQARVIGCLLEKERTTPEYYPLTLNALTTACNQKSSRDPVLNLTESEVTAVIDELIDAGMVVTAYERGSRATKYRHRFCNSEFGQLQLTAPQTALVTLMLLRGAQTAGEFRSRSGRLYEFASLHEVEECLHQLSGAGLVEQLAREPGKREQKWQHRFFSASQASDQASEERINECAQGDILEKIKVLEAQLAALTKELTEIKQLLGEQQNS